MQRYVNFNFQESTIKSHVNQPILHEYINQTRLIQICKYMTRLVTFGLFRLISVLTLFSKTACYCLLVPKVQMAELLKQIELVPNTAGESSIWVCK